MSKALPHEREREKVCVCVCVCSLCTLLRHSREYCTFTSRYIGHTIVLPWASWTPIALFCRVVWKQSRSNIVACFGSILWCTQSGGDHPHEDLATFWLQAKYESKVFFIKKIFFYNFFYLLEPCIEIWWFFLNFFIEFWLLKISKTTWILHFLIFSLHIYIYSQQKPEEKGNWEVKDVECLYSNHQNLQGIKHKKIWLFDECSEGELQFEQHTKSMFSSSRLNFWVLEFF